MNIVEMYELVREIFEKYEKRAGNWENSYHFIGLRFEDKEREIGEICEYSRNNIDRDDERDFPEYDTEEYWEMEELDGTSAWNMELDSTYKIPDYIDTSKDCRDHFYTKHCYVIASNKAGHTSNTVIDDGEIVIKDAVVIAKIF